MKAIKSIGCLWLCLLWVGVAWSAPTGKGSGTKSDSSDQGKVMMSYYAKGLMAFQKQEWKGAKGAFEKVYQLMRKQSTKGMSRREIDQQTLARCVVLYRMVEVADKTKDKLGACRLMATYKQELSTVAPGWESWTSDPNLPDWTKKVKTRTKVCESYPSEVTLTNLPAGAIVSQKVDILVAPSGWKPIKLPVKTFATNVTLQVKAPGFIAWEKYIAVPRWARLSVSPKLKKQPKPVARVVKPVVRRVPKVVKRPAPVVRRVVAVAKRRIPAPRRVVALVPVRRPVKRIPTPAGPKAKGGMPLWAWVAIGAGAAVVVGGGIALAVGLTQEPNEVAPVITQVNTP